MVRLILPRPSDRFRGLAGEDPALVPDGARSLAAFSQPPVTGKVNRTVTPLPPIRAPSVPGSAATGAGPGGSELARLLTVPSQGKLPAVTL